MKKQTQLLKIKNWKANVIKRNYIFWDLREMLSDWKGNEAWNGGSWGST